MAKSPLASSPSLTGALQSALRSHQDGRLADAIQQYRNLLKLAPRNFDAPHMLGVALTQAGETDEGIKTLRQALALNPGSANCKLNLANALMQVQEYSDAISLFQSLLSAGKGNEPVAAGLARCLNELGRHAEALTFCKQAIARFPHSAELFNEVGRAHVALGNPKQAVDDYRKAVELKPAFLLAACNLGNALTEIKAFDEAERVLNDVLKADPSHVQALTNLAHMFRTNWQADRAMETAERALKIAPQDAGLRAFIGGCLIDLGRGEDAEALFRQMIAANERVQEAVIGFSQIHKFKASDPEIAVVERLLADRALAPKDRKPLLFTRAKIEDDLGNHGAAIEAATAAKAVDPYPNGMAAYRDYVRQCMALMDADFFRRHRARGLKDDQPVFILGMPRSGTTLTEQIIASHARADGAGELTAFPAVAEDIGFRRLAPDALVTKLSSLSVDDANALAQRYLAILRKDRKEGALRISDKLPHNFENIWLIALLFPNARVIHCNRNPVDICISIYLRNFSAGHWYSQDLATLGQYFNFYKEMVAHWKAVTGLQWYENDYEALVGEPEHNIRRMIDFLGLPWDEKCLSHTETERTVHTFSKVQVRQPIYKSSVERWRKYAPHIGPLLKELGISPS